MNDATPLPALDLNQRYTVEETCRYLRQSRSKTYEDIAAGRLTIIKDGRRTYCTGRSIAQRSGAEVA